MRAGARGAASGRGPRNLAYDKLRRHRRGSFDRVAQSVFGPHPVAGEYVKEQALVGRGVRTFPPLMPEVQNGAAAVSEFPHGSIADQPDREIRILQPLPEVAVVEAVDRYRVILPHAEIAGLNALPVPESPVTPPAVPAREELERSGAFVPQRPAKPRQSPLVARVVQPASREVFAQPAPLARHEVPGLRQAAVSGNEVGQNEAVPVHEDDVPSRGSVEREIAGPGHTEALVLLAYVVKRIGRLRLEGSDQVPGFARRSIVRDHHFEIGGGLIAEGTERGRQESWRVVGRDHHRDQQGAPAARPAPAPAGAGPLPTSQVSEFPACSPREGDQPLAGSGSCIQRVARRSGHLQCWREKCVAPAGGCQVRLGRTRVP